MFLLLGTLFAFYISKFTIITSIVSVIVVIIALVISLIKKRLSYVILPIVCFTIGVFSYKLAVNNFNKNIETSPNIITARIYQVGKLGDGVQTVYADSVKFDNKKINSNIIINVYNQNNFFENLEVGNIINFKPFAVHKTNILQNYDIPNAYYFKNNLKFYVLTSQVEFVKTDKTFAEIVKEKVKDNLHGGLSNENVEITYSALFGDSTQLSQNTKDAFRLSGIAHILAVSGLHVGIIAVLLSKILQLLKIKGWAKVIVISIILSIYCYICNFSVSVVRATIMSILLFIAPLLKREYDSLNAISIAGIVAFIINPLCVFDISFLMSFSCVLGIVFIAKPISKAISKTRLPKPMSDTLAICISTCVSLIFIQAYFFNRINPISIISNALLLPLFTIAFEIVFCFAFLSLLFPFITKLLFPVNYILDFINISATYISRLPFANITTAKHNYLLIVIYFYLLLIFGRICTAHKKEKVGLTLPIAGLMLAFII